MEADGRFWVTVPGPALAGLESLHACFAEAADSLPNAGIEPVKRWAAWQVKGWNPWEGKEIRFATHFAPTFSNHASASSRREVVNAPPAMAFRSHSGSLRATSE